MKTTCWAALATVAVTMVGLSLVSQAAQPGVKMATEAALWAAGLKISKASCLSTRSEEKTAPDV